MKEINVLILFNKYSNIQWPSEEMSEDEINWLFDGLDDDGQDLHW